MPLSENISDITSSVISDAIEVFAPKLPTAILSKVIETSVHHFLKKKNDAAFEILLNEVRGGSFPTRTEEEISDILGMMLRYQRAAIEGSSRINLRLMASTFKGFLQEKTLYPDKFQSLSNKVSDLTVEEIQAIALVYQYTIEIEKQKPDGFTECDDIGKKIFGPQFEKSSELLAYCASASRTGLIMPQYDGNLFRYASTHLMNELVSLSDFQKIMGEEIEIHGKVRVNV